MTLTRCILRYVRDVGMEIRTYAAHYAEQVKSPTPVGSAT